jgi:hypothetical protein
MAVIPSKPNINKLFVFDTKVSSFYFDYHIEDDVYSIEDPRLKLEAANDDLHGMHAALNEHLNRFLNSPQPIGVLDYAPNTAVALKELHKSIKQEGFGRLLFITFIRKSGLIPRRTFGSRLPRFKQRNAYKSLVLNQTV